MKTKESRMNLHKKDKSFLLLFKRKLQDAIEAVAKEHGYTYIMPKEALIVMPPADDIGPLVIKKLGLKQPSTTTTPAKP